MEMKNYLSLQTLLRMKVYLKCLRILVIVNQSYLYNTIEIPSIDNIPLRPYEAIVFKKKPYAISNLA